MYSMRQIAKALQWVSRFMYYTCFFLHDIVYLYALIYVDFKSPAMRSVRPVCTSHDKY